MTASWPTPQALRASLASRGYVVLPPDPDAHERARAPWDFAERLFGERPAMLERQPIRATPGGRSFASSSVFTPLHSDSQLHLGAPPDAQLMLCLQPAARGGEALLLDTWALLDELARDDPALLRALFETPRRIPFVFGDVFGPTVALRGGSLAFTHSPMARPEDPLARALQARLDARPPTAIRVERGELLVLDNRRVLHGRNAFDDGARAFTRLLVWLSAPLGAHPGYTALARAARDAAAHALSGDDPLVRARFGLEVPLPPQGAARLRAVVAMLQGVAPGALAHRGELPEPTLYAWRDLALRAAAEALAGFDDDLAARCAARLGSRRGG